MPIAKALEELLASQGQAKAIYESNGIIVVKHLLNRDEVDEIRDVFMEYEKNNTSASAEKLSYPRFDNLHRQPDLTAGALVKRLLLDRRFYGTVANLLGDAYGAQSMFFMKPPGARGQAYHQDNFFLGASPDTCVAAWIAVDDCDDDNGGLRVLPGTHNRPVLCHQQSADMDASYSEWQVSVDTGSVPIEAVMEAGDVLFFHGSIVHGSKPNLSERYRRSLVFHYIPQASTKVGHFYQPLVSPQGSDVHIEVGPSPGPCVPGGIPA